jgi:hypothetical protein
MVVVVAGDDCMNHYCSRCGCKERYSACDIPYSHKDPYFGVYAKSGTIRLYNNCSLKQSVWIPRNITLRIVGPDGTPTIDGGAVTDRSQDMYLLYGVRMFLVYGKLTLKNIHLTHANTYGNAFGGALTVYGGGAVTVTNSLFTYNYAGIDWDVPKDQRWLNVGGAAIVVYEGSGEFINCTVSRNVGYRGGGVAIQNGNALFTNCSFTHNKANLAGGAVYVESGTLTFRHCLVAYNSGLWVDKQHIHDWDASNIGIVGGAGFYIGMGEVVCVHCTFLNNSASEWRSKAIRWVDAYVADSGSMFINTDFRNHPSTYSTIIGMAGSCSSDTCSRQGGFRSTGVGCTNSPSTSGGVYCTECHPGMYLNAKLGNAECYLCPPGQYNKEVGQGSCEFCQAGFYQAELGKAGCKECAAGRYGASTISCISIPPGWVAAGCANRTRRSGCANITPCKPRYKCNGTAEMVPCAHGTTTSQKGMIECSPCPAGKAGKHGTCTMCTGNTYADKVRQEACKACPVGKVASNPPATCIVAVESGPGPENVSLLVGSDRRSIILRWDAPSSLISTNSSVTVETTDVDGNTLGALHPSFQVPVNRRTVEIPHLPVTQRQFHFMLQVVTNAQLSKRVYISRRWKVAGHCSDAQYLDDDASDPTLWSCLACPIGASCAGPVAWQGVAAKFGYWRSKKNTFHKCLEPAACLGAANAEFADRYRKYDQPHTESCNTKLGVANHSRLCARCDASQKYVRGMAKGSCSKCNNDANVWELIVACVLATGLTLFLVEITVFRPRTFQLSDGVKKIALSYIQVAALATKVDVPWTKSFDRIFATQSYATSVADAFLSIDCLLPTWSTWEIFQLKLILVLAFPILVAPLACVGVRCRQPKVGRPVHSSFRTYFVSTLVLLLYLVYPTVTKKVTALLTCTVSIDGTSYLQLDPSVPCWKESHLLWVLSVGVTGTLVYVFGLPLMGYRTLRGITDLSDHTAHLQYGILYDGYRNEFWWWEITMVGRKFCIIVIGAFLEGTQQLLTVLFCVASLIFLTAFCQPFVNEQLLRLELMSLSLSFFTFWVGSMLMTDSHGQDDAGGALKFSLAAWSVAALNVVGVGALVYTFATSFWKEKRVALVGWLHALGLTLCCRWMKHRGRRESNMELLPASDYKVMVDDDG